MKRNNITKKTIAALMCKAPDIPETDYQALGLRCGLEIHQQLDTELKTFCRCPIKTLNSKPDARILRHMRPTLSEMGTYDGTALMELKTRKEIVYELFHKHVCTYEMDDTPPFPVNRQALEIALEIGLQVDCSITDELHITRKQYLDGSIPTGFQRTAIIGIGGSVPYKGRDIGIIQLSMEEDACREMSDIGHQITYRTDRLGTPLVEVVTEPHMHTPTELKEVAELLGRLMRATGHVTRGQGATRQDVNVSITGGTRIEIKGVPKLAWMEALVHFEAMRQKGLLEIKDELLKRKITDPDLEGEPLDVTEQLKAASQGDFGLAFEEDVIMLAIPLPRFRGLMSKNCQPGVPFIREFSGRVRVIACLGLDSERHRPRRSVLTDAPRNIICMEEMPALGFPESSMGNIHKQLGLGKDGTFVLVWGSKQDANTAAKEILSRAKEALLGVPNETRQAFPDGTTDFERVLPGPDRMYPDTDSPPIPLDRKWIESIRAGLPVPTWEVENIFAELGLPPHLAKEMALSKYKNIFELINKDMELHPPFVAETLLGGLRYLSRKGVGMANLADELLLHCFKELSMGNLVKSALLPYIEHLAKQDQGGSLDVPAGLRPMPENEWKEQFIAGLESAKSGPERLRAHKSFMAQHRLRVDGAMVLEMV